MTNFYKEGLARHGKCCRALSTHLRGGNRSIELEMLHHASTILEQDASQPDKDLHCLSRAWTFRNKSKWMTRPRRTSRHCNTASPTAIDWKKEMLKCKHDSR